MGLLIRCPHHPDEELDLAYANVEGLTKNKEEVFLFPCHTLVSVDNYDCSVKKIELDDMELD